jgi:dihydropteroate synthase
MSRWEARGRIILDEGDAPRVMGILNLTPDSFSDGGLSTTAEEALIRARSLAADGVDILDLGGESTRPGAEPVSQEQEVWRVIPVVERIASELGPPISIDTSKAEVARRALAAGASIINDVTALRGDPAMVDVAAEFEAGVVLMHMQGVPRTMQKNPGYSAVVAEVQDFLEARTAWCEQRGIPRARIAVDPGIGFGKTFDHNLQLLRNLERFANLGCALLIGTSRKGFLGTLTGRGVSGRASGSVVSSLAACVRGARVVRVHDVAAMVDAIKVWSAVRGWGDAR